MATPTLEDILRGLAARGEITHISLTPSQGGKKWRASFAMSSVFGVSFAEDDDPAQAIILACTTSKLKKPRVTINLKATEVTSELLPTREGLHAAADAVEAAGPIHDATGQPLEPDPLSDLM